MPQLDPKEYAQYNLMLAELEPVIEQLYSSAQNFVSDQIERNHQYKERTLVSPKQLKWLTDLHREFVGTGEAPEPEGIDEQMDARAPSFTRAAHAAKASGPRKVTRKNSDIDDDIPF